MCPSPRHYFRTSLFRLSRRACSSEVCAEKIDASSHSTFVLGSDLLIAKQAAVPPSQHFNYRVIPLPLLGDTGADDPSDTYAAHQHSQHSSSITPSARSSSVGVGASIPSAIRPPFRPLANVSTEQWPHYTAQSKPKTKRVAWSTGCDDPTPSRPSASMHHPPPFASAHGGYSSVWSTPGMEQMRNSVTNDQTPFTSLQQMANPCLSSFQQQQQQLPMMTPPGSMKSFVTPTIYSTQAAAFTFGFA